MFRKILPLFPPDCNKFLHSIAPMLEGRGVASAVCRVSSGRWGWR